MNETIYILVQVIGGLGIFLYGMRRMSESVEEIAGSRLRSLISKMTSSIYRGIGVGALVTAIIQSSSVTTVMAVGFVDAGLMTLRESIGIILGANIGTTITGWILAFKISKYGLPIAGVGALIYLFSKDEKRRKRALVFVGLGMIFMGLTFMKAGVKPIKDMPQFIRFFYIFSGETYRGVVLSALMGTLLTFVLQSSSATVGITIALATQGIIDVQTAVALVLGENIGTTITAYLASLGAGGEAKRVAYAHITIKVVGVVLILPFFYMYMRFINIFMDPAVNIAGFIALSHTVFNCGLVVFFLPFTDLLVRGLNTFIGEKVGRREISGNECLMRMPSVTLEKCKLEVVQMLERFRRDMEIYMEITKERAEEERVEEIFQGEEYQDIKKDEIHRELTGLLNCVSSRKILGEARKLMRAADEAESMGDYGASLGKISIKVRNRGTVIEEKGLIKIEKYHRRVMEEIKNLEGVMREESYEKLSEIRERCEKISEKLSEIDPLEKAKYSRHIVMEILAKYRRINRHLIYIMDVLEKDEERL